MANGTSEADVRAVKQDLVGRYLQAPVAGGAFAAD